MMKIILSSGAAYGETVISSSMISPTPSPVLSTRRRMLWVRITTKEAPKGSKGEQVRISCSHTHTHTHIVLTNQPEDSTTSSREIEEWNSYYKESNVDFFWRYFSVQYFNSLAIVLYRDIPPHTETQRYSKHQHRIGHPAEDALCESTDVQSLYAYLDACVRGVGRQRTSITCTYTSSRQLTRSMPLSQDK